MTHFVSRGGFGDAWIAFLKVREAIHPIATCDTKYWTHCTRRIEHRKSIVDLMNLMPGVVADCELLLNGKVVTQRVREITRFTSGVEIGSNVSELRDKNLDMNFLAGPRPIEEPYVIINPEAGKPANWRAIDKDLLQQIVNDSSIRTVFLGKKPEHTNSARVSGNVVDMCGRTSVSQLINWIYYAESFFAFDGAIAYMAMSMGKRGTVLFTHDEKKNGASQNYMCDRWRDQVLLGYSNKMLRNLADVKWAR